MKREIKSGIYKITCIENHKFYIGSSKDIEKRWRQHKNTLRLNKHVNIIDINQEKQYFIRPLQLWLRYKDCQ